MADEVTVNVQPCCSGHNTGINSKKKHPYNVDFKLQALVYADQHRGKKAAKKFGVDSWRIREWKQQKTTHFDLQEANDNKRCWLEGKYR